MKSSQGLYSHKTVHKCWGERHFCHAALCHEKGSLSQTSRRSAINSKGFAPEFLNFVSFLRAWATSVFRFFKLPVWKACRESKCRTSPEENNKKTWYIQVISCLWCLSLCAFQGGITRAFVQTRSRVRRGKQPSLKPAASSPVKCEVSFLLDQHENTPCLLEKSNNN